MLFDIKMAVNIIKELEPIINFDINLIGNDGIKMCIRDRKKIDMQSLCTTAPLL